MARDIGKKITALRKALGETQAIFGERFDVEQATVSRWEKGEPPQRKYEKPIADLAKMTVAEFFHSADKPRLIPIVGDLSGAAISIKETPQPGGPVSHISLSLGENDQIAITVSDNTLAPVYRQGDTIIANRLSKAKMAKAVGRDCIVMTATGDAFIKNLRKGLRKGAYNLRDLRPTEDDIDDVDLQWAAPILWIGRAQ